MKNISEWLASNGATGAAFIKADRRWARQAGSSWYRAPPALEVVAGLDFRGAEHPGHLLVTAGRVARRPVFDVAGVRVGQVFDVALDKRAGKVIHVLVETGGLLGFGQRFRALPWALFTYAVDRGGYVLPLTRSEFETLPSLRRSQLEWCGGGHRSPFDIDDANTYLDLPIA